MSILKPLDQVQVVSEPWRGPPRGGLRTVRRRLETPGFFLWLILLLVAGIVVWAALTKVDRVVKVEGRVIPAGHNQSLQHLEGGIVAAIMVHEGSVVKKGEILLVIDDTPAQASLAESKVKLEGLRLRAARLDAEANERSSMSVPRDLKDQREFVASETQLFTARRQKLDQERLVLEEQIRQRTAELHEVEARQVRLKGEQATAGERLKLIKRMAARDAASQLEVLEAQSREQRIATELGDAVGTRPKLMAAIAEAQARIADAKARYRADAQGELANVLMEISRLENAITAQADRYVRTEVRAPVDGIVNRIAVNTVGGVVKPGDTIIEITPSTDTIMLEARARPADRAELQVGLPATIRVSAYDVGEFGTLSGHVTEVSADTMPDTRGEAYYRVGIQVDKLPPSYAGKQLVPGMTITGDVVIGQRTILAYVTSPFTRFAYNAFRDAR